jgi:DNA helicase IV
MPFVSSKACSGRGRYLNYRPVEAWLHRALEAVSGADLGRIRAAIQKTIIPTTSGLARLLPLIEQYEEIVEQENGRFVAEERQNRAAFFTRVEKNPLTERQVEAIIRDEDNAIVVAGAGTGKTSTVIGKVGYLVEAGIAEPTEILALAFGNDAAREMRERVKERTGHKVEIRTFHSLGFEIVRNVDRQKPALASMAVNERQLLFWIDMKLSEVLNSPKLRSLYIDFAIYHRYPARYQEEFKSRGEYLQYLRDIEPQTLMGEMVKSFEERLVADFLTLHGVRYEYEYPYEHDTATESRRQYKPDFFLTEYGIYLEHFGIDRNGRTAPGISASAYKQGMEWKRQLHSKHGTTLLESYSYERMEGILLPELERKLTAAGVKLLPLDVGDLQVLLERHEVNKRLVALLNDFLSVFKENLGNLAALREVAERSPDPVRNKAFVDLFEVIYGWYEDYLAERREIDFTDMIVRATRYVEEGALPGRFHSRHRRRVPGYLAGAASIPEGSAVPGPRSHDSSA